jgi:hypothetical protein
MRASSSQTSSGRARVPRRLCPTRLTAHVHEPALDEQRRLDDGTPLLHLGDDLLPRLRKLEVVGPLGLIGQDGLDDAVDLTAGTPGSNCRFGRHHDATGYDDRALIIWEWARGDAERILAWTCPVASPSPRRSFKRRPLAFVHGPLVRCSA